MTGHLSDHARHSWGFNEKIAAKRLDVLRFEIVTQGTTDKKHGLLSPKKIRKSKARVLTSGSHSSFD